MFAVLSLRRVRVAGVAARAVTIDARSVVPAAGVLAEVAAERARIADLRTRHAACGRRQHAVFAEHQLVRRDLAQRGQRADLESLRGFADAIECRDAADID